MRWRAKIISCVAIVGICVAGCHKTDMAVSDLVIKESLAKSDIVSGTEFLTSQTREAQADDFLNPGFLWVEAGKTDFQSRCSRCHAEDAEGGKALALDLGKVAAKYPKIDPRVNRLVNLEGRINLCQTEHLNAPALAYDSPELLSLSAYLAHSARGARQTPHISGPLKPYFEAGQRYFFTRRGQFNLSCQQCHDQNWGRKMRGDFISQGHGTGFPTYRNEWQSLGSLHRRFQDCDVGVRAAPKALGSETYTALELYLAYRAQGLPLDAPSMRR